MEAKFRSMTVGALQSMRNEYEQKINALCKEFMEETDLQIGGINKVVPLSFDGTIPSPTFEIQVMRVI